MKAFTKFFEEAKKVFSDPQSINKRAVENGETIGRSFSKIGKGAFYVIVGGFLLFLFGVLYFLGGFFKSLLKLKED